MSAFICSDQPVNFKSNGLYLSFNISTPYIQFNIKLDIQLTEFCFDLIFLCNSYSYFIA